MRVDRCGYARAPTGTRRREVGGMVTLRSGIAVVAAAVLLTGCSRAGPHRVDAKPLPSCTAVSTALFHVGMTAPEARPAPTAAPIAATCAFASKQRYGLTYGSVLVMR